MASVANLKRLVSEEYKRLAKDREYLRLDDIIDFHLSVTGRPVDPGHLGVLLAIDRDRDGRFPEEELQAFASSVHERAAEFQQYQPQSMVHGSCMLDLWRSISTNEGLAKIADWLVVVAKENHESTPSDRSPQCIEAVTPSDSLLDARMTAPTGLMSMVSDKLQPEPDTEPRTFPHRPQILYVHKTALVSIHRILRSHDANAYEFDTFIDTLQRVAEDQQLLELADSTLDDWVPEPVLRAYFVDVLVAMRQLVADMDVLRDLLHPATH